MEKLTAPARPPRALPGALAALALLVAALALASAVVVPKNNQEEFGQLDPHAHGVLGEPRNSIDVLFLGDSEAYSAFSPLQLWHERGVRSYVCATSGQRLCYTRTMLLRALRAQSPGVVVLETNCLFSSLTAADVAVRLAKDLFPVFEYHDRWKRLRLEDLTETPRATWSDELRGFYANEDVRAADPTGYMAPDDAVAEVPALAELHVADIARICAENGARLVLVSTPSTVNWNMARHNGVRALAGRLGLEHVDLSVGEDAVEIDWSRDTRDAGDHLNLSGAQKVTSAVGAILAERLGVPDRRGEHGHEAWDDAYARFAP